MSFAIGDARESASRRGEPASFPATLRHEVADHPSSLITD
jgi:hypothetical protein